MENKTSICIEFLLLLATIIIVFFAKWLNHSKKRRKTTKPPLPPGPTGYPIIGCLPEMTKKKPTFRWIHKLMQEMDTEIACFRLGGTHVIPVTSPELSREFLKEHDLIFASRPHCMSARLTSCNYLSTVIGPIGDQWKKMRRILSSHALSSAMHTKLHDKRDKEADHLVRYVYTQLLSPQNNNKNGLVNLRVATQHYCGNVIRKMVFGKRFFGAGMEDGGPGLEEREHVDGLFTILTYLYGFAIADYVPCLEVFDFDGYRKILGDALDNVRKYQDREITNRVEMWRKGIKKTEDDILDVFINLKDSKHNPLLSVQEIRAQITEIMLAGVDNPSNAVEWAMAEMINQPHILNRACRELDSVVGRGKMVQESDLPNLNYVRACVKESFRLHPVAPFNVPHVSTEDAVVGGYFIPRGSHVLLSRPGLGRNPRVWENPLEYKPERHMVFESAQVELVDHDLRMLSFSTGRRGCPGVTLGSTMAVMLLARLLHGFDWMAPPGVRIDLVESEGVLLLAKPLVLHATPRLEPSVLLK
ncbi:hypothetical protein ABFS82_14G015300 [Erythranthe guttata]|uniref:Tyrosine N-monooxygenase n=1 Tax=Erythranthe guttata TaxID=4155 RepID=A0A022RYN2_ERYGU|nr:PREDICTED: valine N-monooxygenase 1-like isoform X3 [Erythranthe guttata]EYU45627.1 hypothetical protein MIMGU_mgv1a004405mg [Erythranthe guttata]|eukprot:XP_012841423.1 PREDICTED: valine N-monooxygenase 1-like isoform X3 [Erythranthe guttata]